MMRIKFVEIYFKVNVIIKHVTTRKLKINYKLFMKILKLLIVK